MAAAVSPTPSPVSDSSANATTGKAGASFANNTPVGSAGQPAKMAAIQKRLSAMSNNKKGNL